jgi:hypothetical protein
MQLVGVLVGRGNQFSAVVEDKSGPGTSHFKLRQEMSKPGVFDDDGKDALTFLVDVDRAGERDRPALADRMVDHSRPSRPVGLDRSLEPGLVDDAEVCWRELAGLEFDVAGDDGIFIDPALTRMVGQRGSVSEISIISRWPSPSLWAAKNEPSGQPKATQEMSACD